MKGGGEREEEEEEEREEVRREVHGGEIYGKEKGFGERI